MSGIFLSLTGTALAESGACFVRQVANGGVGPARGLWQMEPFTHDDIWNTFLSNARLATLKRNMLSMRSRVPYGADQMVGNAFYACGMARLKYYRAPDALPAATDAAAMAQMHKAIYNTALGAANAERNIPFFQQAIAA